MYERLTKLIKDDKGHECIVCIDYGTDRCRLHNGVPDCIHCPMLCAIMNQLYIFEEVMFEKEG